MYTVVKAVPGDVCSACKLPVGRDKILIPLEKDTFCRNCMADHHIFTVQQLYSTGLINKLPPEVRQ